MRERFEIACRRTGDLERGRLARLMREDEMDLDVRVRAERA